ncbi:TetR family transcriptional regulator C-terminal domain-containing protein [Micrococcales bacterium 31B]|nr:TetR family transcriptional regulator C-terminal domain-containing protein [Micrococcales bacterium 31B]
MAEQSSGPRRMSPAERRDQIIQAARPMLGERGLHACTIRDIAHAARVAVGTVTYHFSGIAEILAASLDAEMTDYSARHMRAAQAQDGPAACRILVDGLIADGPVATRHWSLWLDFWALAAHDAEYSSWQRRVYEALHECCETALGGLAPAIEFVALMDGLVVQTYVQGSRLTPAEARATLHAWLDRFEAWGGIGSAGGATPTPRTD